MSVISPHRNLELMQAEENSRNWHGFIVNFDCEQNQRLLQHIPANLFRSSTYKWLIWSLGDDLVDEIGRFGLNLTFESDVKLILANNGTSLIHDVFKFDPSWPLNATIFGWWNEASGLVVRNDQPKSENRKNMHGLVISAGLALPELGTVSEEVYRNHHFLQSKDYYGRRDYDLWSLIAEMHNITSSIYVTDNYGNVKSPTVIQYDGFIGKLQRRELDVGFSVIRNMERMRAVDYSRADVTLPPVQSINRAAFVFFEPVTLNRWRALYDSFSTTTWIVVSSISIVSACFFSFGLNFERNFRPSVYKYVLFIVGAISQQGLEMEPNKSPGRIVALTFMMFSFLVYNYYNTALIISLLSPPPFRINSLRDLIDSDLELLSEDIPYNKAFFRSYNVSILNEAYDKKMKDKDAFVSLEDGLTKVRNGSSAFEADIRHLFLEMETTFTDSEKCKIRVLDLFPFKVSRAFVVQKDSYYNEFISSGFLLLLERGLTGHVESVWDVQKPVCFAREYAAAELDELLFAFFILALGYVFSGLAFVIEVIAHGKAPSKRSHDKRQQEPWKKLSQPFHWSSFNY
nr:PREDICTED: uncharacterized protein LOC109035262 [Bemisia tabaci]